MSVRIPYTDYSLMATDVRKEVLAEINRVILLRNSSEHEQYVAIVEGLLTGYFQTKFGIAVDSGTSALQLALAALGVGDGDEVIVPAYTYVSTALAVTNLGARPVFVDVKLTDLTINPERMAARITSRTKAVIPVHIHGFCCDIYKIKSICLKYRIAMVEDASQAHGALLGGRKAGSFGIGCFSLHTSKNLGGIGDSGFIALNDKVLYKRIKSYLIPDSGAVDVLEARRTPCAMDSIQAAIIKKKLHILDRINIRKNEIARLYDAHISGVAVKKPVAMSDSYPVYRDYYILVNDRDTMMSNLRKKGIESRSGYRPLYLLKTFQKFAGRGRDFPVAEKISDRVLCLPSFYGMRDEQVKYICGVLRKLSKRC